MLIYPESLPLPLQADYAVSVAPNIKRSTMSDGWIRQRKVTSNTPDSVTVSFYFNEVQMGVFLDFIEALNEGADWFQLKLPTNVIDDNEDHVIALKERVVRFQSGKYSEKLNFYEGSQWLWKITATLDIQKELFHESTADDSWNTDSQYDFEFVFNSGMPVIKGKKKCFLVSRDTPSGASENPSCININTSDNTGINFYSEGLQLDTSHNKILEIDTLYKGVSANSYNYYYYLGRVKNTDKSVNGVGLFTLRNNTTEYGRSDNFNILNAQLNTVSYTVNSYHVYAVNIPYNTEIHRRDIFINKPSENKCYYYCVMNDQLVVEAVINSCITFSAVLYQIGDTNNSGSYNWIKLYSVYAKNGLIGSIPEHD